MSGAIEWRRVDLVRSSLYTILSLITAGLLPFVGYYVPNLRKKLISKPCHPEMADMAVIVVNDQEHMPELSHHKDFQTREHAIVFEIDSVRYLASSLDNYQYCRVPDVPKYFARFLVSSYEQEQTLDTFEQEQRLLALQYGPNVMSIPESSFFDILMKQLLSPFFLFQYFAATIWFIEAYYLYAVIIVVITLGSAYLNAKETMFNLERLRALAGVQSNVHIVSSSARDSKRRLSAKVSQVLTEELVMSASPDSALMPGTKFLVTEGMVLPCDAILVTGKVVVDESMLTGESVPVSKTPIEMSALGDHHCENQQLRQRNMLQKGSLFDGRQRTDTSSMSMDHAIGLEKRLSHASEDDSAEEQFDIAGKLPGNVLFGGTRVRACYGQHCIAVTYRTGFRSAKGQLVASLLQPKDGFINFVSDAIGIILVTTFTISIVYIGIAIRLESLGASKTEAFFYYLDAITIAVPPGLTACLTIATSIAIGRLKLKKIFVSDTTRVNFGGVITAACFDKTGTLTESALQLLGAICTPQVLTVADAQSIRDSATSDALHDYKVHSGTDTSVSIAVPSQGSSVGIPFFCHEIMATCHGLDLQGVDSSSARGDPLEEELLRASQWRLAHVASSRSGQLVAFPPDIPASVVDEQQGYFVLKHFEFTPEKLRAASLVREPSGKLVYLLKGSPEVVVRLCDPSTVPSQIASALSGLAKEGLRVIAIAHKECTLNESTAITQTQEQLESENGSLKFIGLLYLSSSLKKETKKTIFNLQRAKVHVNMITGDHIHTAISVAGSCGILKYKTEHAAPVSGKTRRRLFIVDQDSRTDELIIIDAATEQRVHDVTLAELIFEAARSYHHDMRIQDSIYDFAIPKEGVDSVREGESLVFASLDENDAHDADIDMGGVLNPIRRLAEHMASTHPETAPEAVSSDLNSRDIEDVAMPGLTVGLSKSLVEIAVTGKGLHGVFRDYPMHTALSMVRFAKVFARTKPYDKKYIVESLLESCPVQLLQMARADSSLDLIFDDSADSGSWWTQLTNIIGGQSTAALHKQRLSDATHVVYPEDYLPSNDELMQRMDVLFCGDGANDMIALRAATVGVSLCDTETSVAAPITSCDQTPFAVVDVLKEGRCSLVTAYVLIIFNMNYAVIQLCLAFSMYYYGLKIGDYMYLTQDLFFAFLLGLAISLSGPTPQLSEQLPPKRFFVPFIMTRLLLSIIAFGCFQILSLYILRLQSFYEPFETDDPLTDTYSYETSAIFNLSLGQMLIAAIVSTIGKPFREAWYKNKYFNGLFAVLAIYVLFQIFGGDNYFLTNIMQVEPLPVYFGFIEVALIMLHFLVCYAIRSFCEHFFSLKKKNLVDFKWLKGKKTSSNAFSRATISKALPRALHAKSPDSHTSSDERDIKPLLSSVV